MKIVPYIPPEWAKSLKFTPRFVIDRLVMRPTPIHSWRLPNIPPDFQLSIKRDDMTGSVLGGNKIRKLEFILADVLRSGCRHLITTGGVNSNHARATAGAGRLLGLKTHLFLRSDNPDTPHRDLAQPNLLLDRLFGADVYLMPRKSRYLTELLPAMEELKRHLGGEACLVPLGGSNAVGVFGPIQLWEEIRGQQQEVDDVVLAVGSGGTASGLAIANYLCKSPVRVHAFSVCDDEKYFLGHCQEMMDALGVAGKAEDILHVIDGYKGAGYGIASPQLLTFIQDVAQTTGVILDPVYTGKAAFGLSEEIRQRPQQFAGRRILFVHTGGLMTADALKSFEEMGEARVTTWTGTPMT